MLQDFVTTELSEAELPQALPLLCATWPRLDLASWERYALAFRENRAGQGRITGMHDSSGGLCGLFASRIEDDLGRERTLAVPLFTALDIRNSLAPVRTLLETAEVIARRQGCTSAKLHLTSEQDELGKRLRRLGLSLAGTCYRSELGSTFRLH